MIKVVIPVAGIGSRLRPHTHTQPKALVPVAGKPIISHIVDNLVAAGCDDFVFVVGYMGDKIESYILNKYPDLKISFIPQEPRRGLGHAVWLCKDLIKDAPVFIVLGDTIFEANLHSVLIEKGSMLGVRKVENPGSFGVVELDDDGNIDTLVEKPRIPKSNLALVGLYKIDECNELLEALKYNIDNNITTLGEFHLTDGIMRMIENGTKMKTFVVENWYDCGAKASLLATNALMLKRKDQPVHENYLLENSIIIPPVSIADGCKVMHSIIGPNVSIGENTLVKSSIVSDSIIGGYSELENTVLNSSLVGSDTSLKGLSQSLNIGDSTEIHFV